MFKFHLWPGSGGSDCGLGPEEAPQPPTGRDSAARWPGGKCGGAWHQVPLPHQFPPRND